MQQGQHPAGLAGQVLQHDPGFEILVRVVGAAAAAHELAPQGEGQGVLLGHGLQQVGLGMALFQTGELLLAQDGILGQPGGHRRGKALLQPDEIEHVANVQEAEKLVLGHDLPNRPKRPGAPRWSIHGVGAFSNSATLMPPT